MATAVLSKILHKEKGSPQEYICARDYMKAKESAALGLKPAADLVKRVQCSESADGRIKFDNQLPELHVDGKVHETWADSKDGRISQIEGVLTNRTTGTLRDIRLVVEPAENVVQFWNLIEVKQGTYDLANYWNEDEWMGGLPAGVTLYWGGIIRGEGIKMTFKHRPAGTPAGKVVT